MERYIYTGIYTVQKKKRITHFYFSKCKFCDLPGKIKWPI